MAFWLIFLIPAYPAEHHIQYYANLLVKHPQAVLSLVSRFVCGCITLHFHQTLKLVFWELPVFKLFIFNFKQSIFVSFLPIFQFTTAPYVSLLSSLFTGHFIYSLFSLKSFSLVFILLLFWLGSKPALTFVKG